MTVLLKRSRYLFIVLIAALFFSCSAKIDGILKEDGSAELSLETSLGRQTRALIRSIMGVAGSHGEEVVLNGEEISRSMANAPGIRAVSLKNTSPTAIQGTISLSNVGGFLTAASSKSRFITYTSGRTAGSSSIVIALDRSSAPHVISMLSPEVEDHLMLLMAPALFGDATTKQEYLDLLAGVYGRPLADEIANSKVALSVEFPRQITSVKGGKAAGRKAEFEVPLTDILVLEEPLRYEVVW